MLCPSCRVKTAPLDEKGIMAAQCPQCQGIWVSKMALDRLTRREADQPGGVLTASGPGLQELAARVTQTDTVAEITCPYCCVAMVKERFHPMIPVQTDRCPKCDYIWLDPGEMDLLLRLYRDLMSEDDPSVADKRDKLARLDTMRAAMRADLAQATNNDVNRVRNVSNNVVNTGLNIANDLNARNPGVSVAADVAEFLINMLIR